MAHNALRAATWEPAPKLSSAAPRGAVVVAGDATC